MIEVFYTVKLSRKFTYISVLALSLLVVFIFLGGSKAHAAYDGGNIIDNSIFLNAKSMTKADIQNFLAGKGAGLANLTFTMDCDIAGAQAKQAYLAISAPCGQANIPASHIIYYSSQIYGINPQVILATMQKEQSLTTAANPTSWQINQAMGYNCPTSGGCSASTFFYQIDNGAWVMRFHYERARGNLSWWYQSTSWTCGTEKAYYKPNLSPGQNVNFFDQDGVYYRTHFIVNAATSAFYCYTPHAFNNHRAGVPIQNVAPGSLCYSSHPEFGSTGRCYTGSFNFVKFFELWFGSTRSGVCYSNDTVVKTDVAFHKYDSKADSADFLIYSGSGSSCVESHIWNPGFTSWKAHIASNQPSISPDDLQVRFGDLDGGSRDYPLLFGLQNTTTAKIESHVWAKNFKNYLAHASSNRATINPADSEIAVADLDGNGRDDPILVVYRNTGSGMIELHGWSEGMQSWAYNTATNLPAVDPSKNSVAFGDIDGNGRDEAILLAKTETGSDRVEFHVWNPGQWSWQSHIVSNLPEINTTDSKIMLADLDGNGIDEAVLVGLQNTGSGRIEFHVWNSGFTSWSSHAASNQTY